MATVIYAARSLSQIARAVQFPGDATPQAALAVTTAIRSAVESLAGHPLLGRRISGDVRELVISYGKTGFVALYRFVVPRDEVRILAIGNQRELGFFP